MKILMFPGKSVAENNKYIDILVSEMNTQNVEVEDWNKYKPLQNADVFHVHWPELLIWLKNRRYRSLEGRYFIWNFLNTINRVKKSGGIVVWTVHGLGPHKESIKSSIEYRSIIKSLTDSIDGFFVLTEAGVEEIQESYPGLENKPWIKTQHPSYTEVLSVSSLNSELRNKYNLSSDKWVGALLGNMRPNKKADVAAAVFTKLDPQKYHLFLGGNISSEFKQELDITLNDAQNITADFGYLSDEKIAEYYAMSDAIIFPSNNYFNSGTIYTALSLNIPVIAAKTKTNIEIQKVVGDEWLFLFEGELTEKVVIEASNSVISRIDKLTCDMSYFSPEKAVKSIIDGYVLLKAEKDR